MNDSKGIKLKKYILYYSEAIVDGINEIGVAIFKLGTLKDPSAYRFVRASSERVLQLFHGCDFSHTSFDGIDGLVITDDSERVMNICDEHEKTENQRIKNRE